VNLLTITSSQLCDQDRPSRRADTRHFVWDDDEGKSASILGAFDEVFPWKGPTDVDDTDNAARGIGRTWRGSGGRTIKSDWSASAWLKSGHNALLLVFFCSHRIASSAVDFDFLERKDAEESANTMGGNTHPGCGLLLYMVTAASHAQAEGR